MEGRDILKTVDIEPDFILTIPSLLISFFQHHPSQVFGLQFVKLQRGAHQNVDHENYSLDGGGDLLTIPKK